MGNRSTTRHLALSSTSPGRRCPCGEVYLSHRVLRIGQLPTDISRVTTPDIFKWVCNVIWNFATTTSTTTSSQQFCRHSGEKCNSGR